MQVEQISQEGSKVLLRLTASFDEYVDAAARGVQAFLLSSDADVPDAERLDDILAQTLGADADLEGAKVDFAANYLVPRAVRERDIWPVCSPDFQPQAKPEAGGQLVIDIVVYPKPELTLSSYDPVAIEVRKPKLTDGDVDAQIVEMARAVRIATLGDAGNLSSEDLANMRDPYVDDAWVAAYVPDPNINTVAEMRAEVRRSGEEQLELEFEQMKLSAAAFELGKRLAEPVPQDLIEAMQASMLSELDAQARQQGYTTEQMITERGYTMEEIERSAFAEAEEMLRQGLALDAMFRHAQLTVSESDMRAALSSIAPGHEDEAEQNMREGGYLFTIEETASRLRAGAYTVEQAIVNIIQ